MPRRNEIKSVVRAGNYRQVLQLEKQINFKNAGAEDEQAWVPQGEPMLGSVEAFGGYEGAQMTSRQDTSLLTVETRANFDYRDMNATDYRWRWIRYEDADLEGNVEESVEPLEQILSIQTFRNVFGKDRRWLFLCVSSIARRSS